MSASLVAVFIPLLLMGGMVGRSVPRVLRDAVRGDPDLAAGLPDHHPHDVRRAPPARKEGPAHGRFYRASERVFELMRHTYDRSLGWALRHPRFMLTLMLCSPW